jgi:hypothetical protein
MGHQAIVGPKRRVTVVEGTGFAGFPKTRIQVFIFRGGHRNPLQRAARTNLPNKTDNEADPGTSASEGRDLTAGAAS